MTERDAELLRNRIQLLEREEKRTLQRISEANRQAALMYERKRNANTKYAERHNFRSELAKNMRACQRDNQLRKQHSRALKMKAETDMLDRKRQMANDVKAKSRKLAEMKRHMEKASSERVHHSHIAVMRQRQACRQKKMEREKARQKKSELGYLVRVVDERVLQQMKQTHLSRLENAESTMIRRVENARIMQTEALEGLCKVVCTSPPKTTREQRSGKAALSPPAKAAASL